MKRRDGFRLEKIRKLRNKLEDLEKMKLRSAYRLREQAEDALKNTRQRLHQNGERRLRRQREGCAAKELQRDWWHRLRLKSEENRRLNTVRQSRRRVQQRTQELIQARQKSQMMENLKEKYRQKQRQRARDLEQKLLDDVAGYQYVSRGGEEILD